MFDDPAQQQDAGELLTYLLATHTASPGLPAYRWPPATRGTHEIVTSETITCDTCHTEGAPILDTHHVLQLESATGRPLQSRLQDRTRTEHLDGDNRFHCDLCAARHQLPTCTGLGCTCAHCQHTALQPAQRRQRVTAPLQQHGPDTLVIQILGTRAGEPVWVGDRPVYHNNMVERPDAPHTIHFAGRTYQLQCAIIHSSGDVHAGHYTVLV